MNDELNERSNKIRDFTEELLDRNAHLIEEAQRALSNAEKRYLEYFWNVKRQVPRKEVPLSVISFLEVESKHDSLSNVVEARVRADLSGLVAKGYLETTHNAMYRLTPLGVAYIKDAHPSLIVLWERLWEKTPKFVSLLVAVVGFISSVFGIAQFFHGG